MNMTPEARESLTKTVAGLREAADQLERDLNQTNVLDGTPFILYVQPFGDEGKLLYGQPYADQVAKGQKGYCFRLQRAFHLCGVLCMDERGAQRYAGKQLAFSTASGAVTHHVVKYQHRRDWAREELDRLLRSIAQIEDALGREPAALAYLNGEQAPV